MILEGSRLVDVSQFISYVNQVVIGLVYPKNKCTHTFFFLMHNIGYDSPAIGLRH